MTCFHIKTERERLLEHIKIERERQDRRWGGAVHDDRHSIADWVGFINAYTGWARQMVNMNSIDKARRRSKQVAALAIAAYSSLYRREGWGQNQDDSVYEALRAQLQRLDEDYGTPTFDYINGNNKWFDYIDEYTRLSQTKHYRGDVKASCHHLVEIAAYAARACEIFDRWSESHSYQGPKTLDDFHIDLKVINAVSSTMEGDHHIPLSCRASDQQKGYYELVASVGATLATGDLNECFYTAIAEFAKRSLDPHSASLETLVAYKFKQPKHVRLDNRDFDLNPTGATIVSYGTWKNAICIPSDRLKRDCPVDENGPIEPWVAAGPHGVPRQLLRAAFFAGIYAVREWEHYGLPCPDAIHRNLFEHDLACFYCNRDYPCHADVLLLLANYGSDGLLAHGVHDW